jgi:hypothetical protein
LLKYWVRLTNKFKRPTLRGLKDLTERNFGSWARKKKTTAWTPDALDDLTLAEAM